MNLPSDHLASFTAKDNALLLASVSSSAERELLNSWLEDQRRDNPGVQLTMLQLPDDDPPPVQLARLSDQLGEDDGRSVVPVRVFWAPDGNSNLAKMAGLLAGRDPYRPTERLQRKILHTHPARAQVVAGAPATVDRTAQAVARHHHRRNPDGFRPVRHPPGRAGPRTGRIPFAGAGIQVAATRQARDAGVGPVPCRPGQDPRAPPSRKPARSSTRWPPAGAGCRWTCCPRGIGRCSSAASIPRSTTTSRRSR